MSFKKKARILIKVISNKVLIVACLSWGLKSFAEAEANRPFKSEKIFEFDDVPWGIDFVNQTLAIVSLKEGELVAFDLKNKKIVAKKKISVKEIGQGGLLDVLITSRNDKNVTVHFTYAQKASKKNPSKKSVPTYLARVNYNLKQKKFGSIENLFESKVYGDGGRHFGSRLLKVGDNLFMTIGDRGNRNYAQKLDWHNGKILRLTMDGKSAPGNPFVSNSSAEKIKNALPEIWSYGHRNPQGIAINPKTGNIWSSEFGPRGGDELNLILPGKNYGWPIVTRGKEYWGPSIGKLSDPTMEEPKLFWVPSISPSGLAYWKGSLFLANLSSTHIRKVQLKNSEPGQQLKLFEDKDERFRHVRVGLDDLLYATTDQGSLYRIKKQ